MCDTSCACTNNEQYKTYKLVPKVDRNSRLTFLFCEKEFQIDCHRTKIFISEDFSNLWIGKRISEDFSNLWIGKRVSEAQPSSPSANIVPFGPVKHPRCSTGNQQLQCFFLTVNQHQPQPNRTVIYLPASSHPNSRERTELEEGLRAPHALFHIHVPCTVPSPLPENYATSYKIVVNSAQ